MNQEVIKSFTDLKAWQQGHKLVLAVYEITKTFPTTEQFGLTNQLRRAAVSITSNLAEGFSRQSFKEKLQFYCVTQGSVTEVQNQLIIARDVGYISPVKFSEIAEQAIIVHKVVNGLIRGTRERIPA